MEIGVGLAKVKVGGVVGVRADADSESGKD